MKSKLFILLLFINFTFSQEKIDESEIVKTLCDKFSSEYSANNDFDYNTVIYLKSIKMKLSEFDETKRENILRKLHESCPNFLEYSLKASKIAALEKGEGKAFELWEKFYKSKNSIPWTIEEKERFLSICYYALSKRNNNEKLCNCSIDKIAEHLTADYFLNISIEDQGYLAGQVNYVYCAE